MTTGIRKIGQDGFGPDGKVDHVEIKKNIDISELQRGLDNAIDYARYSLKYVRDDHASSAITSLIRAVEFLNKIIKTR